MATLALVIGGLAGHVLLCAVVAFFVLGGIVILGLGILELRDAWKRRVP